MVLSDPFSSKEKTDMMCGGKGRGCGSACTYQCSEIAVVLTHAEEDDWDRGGVDHAHEGADHVPHGIAFADDEACKKESGPGQ